MVHSLFTVVLVWCGASVPLSLAIAQLFAHQHQPLPVQARITRSRQSAA